MFFKTEVLRFILPLLICFPLLLSCEEDKVKAIKEMQTYNGPIMEGNDIETLYSDSAQIRIRMKAPLQQEYESGNRVFPKGLYIEFFNEKGQLSTTLKANHAKYDKATDVYIATGDVIVKDLLEDKQLNTEELHWNKLKREIYTDKFVRITDKGLVSMGTGLTATQDFKKWRINKYTGDIPVSN